MRLFKRNSSQLERQVEVLSAQVEALTQELHLVQGDTYHLKEDISKTRHSLRTLRERYERYIRHK